MVWQGLGLFGFGVYVSFGLFGFGVYGLVVPDAIVERHVLSRRRDKALGFGVSGLWFGVWKFGLNDLGFGILVPDEIVERHARVPLVERPIERPPVVVACKM